MASIQLVGCDDGLVAVFVDIDDLTLLARSIRGINKGRETVTVVINGPILDRETKLTIRARTMAEEKTDIALGKEILVEPAKDKDGVARRGFFTGMMATALFPGE